MDIRLSDHFTYGKLLRFVIPSIIMMIFTSVYMVVDGLFVSNCVGKVPFAAMNLITPLLMVMSTIGFMFAAGGAAIVARLLGEGENEKANQYFSMFVYVILISGILLMMIGQLSTEPFARMLGAKGDLLKFSVLYARINFCSLPFFMNQIAFQSFYNTAGKPRLGLIMTLIAGLSMRFIRLRSLFFGKPSLLIIKGTINQTEMRRNRFTPDELMQELRSQGVTDIASIEYAILETDGKLNLIPFPAERPVTAAQLQLPTQDGGYPHIVVSDGRMLEANLRHLGLDPAWLREELTRQGVERTEDVYLMTVDESRRCYLTRKEAEA